jgi:peptide/nickel transport system substrate-binding protein
VKLSPRYRKRLVPVLIAGVAVASLALTACAGGDSGGASSPTATPVAGGTLKVQLSAAPNCLDPAVAFSANERAVVRPLVDSLVDMDPATGKIVPWLASSWDINADDTAYTFHLKPGITFSDGSPVDAAAVKSTFDYVTTTDKTTSSRGVGYLRGYTGTKIIDPQTAEIDFSAPNVQFLPGASTSTLGILSTSSAAATAYQRCAGTFVGSGPFTLKDYTQGQSADLVKRAGYASASSLASHTGDAYLDGIAFQVVNVSNARDGALESKQSDVAIDIATQDVPQLQAAGVTPLFGTQPGMPASLMVNTTRPGLDDPAIRNAMEIGFDRASDVTAVLGTYYKPATSILTSNLPQYKDESSLITFDADKAKSDLDAAGWVVGADGIRAKDGTAANFAVTFTSTFGAYYTSLLQLFQQQMKDIGIGITLKDGTQAAQFAVSTSHDYDLDITTLTDVDPDIIRSSAALILDKPTLDQAGITALFTTSQQQANPADRTATYGQIQDSMIQNGYIIPFWEGGQFVGYGSNVMGLKMDFQSWLDFYDTSLVQ